MEMGNSPDMVIKSYREVVTEEQAKKFWDLNPEEAKKLINKLAAESLANQENRREGLKPSRHRTATDS